MRVFDYEDQTDIQRRLGQGLILAFACAVYSLWEGIKAVGLLSVGESHSHARSEWRVKDDGGALIARSQVHRGHSANALTIHDHILWTDPIPMRRTVNNCYCKQNTGTYMTSRYCTWKAVCA